MKPLGVKKSTLVQLMLVMVTVVTAGCSHTDTKYRVPDYYSQELVPRHYQPGSEYSVNAMRCSQQSHQCRQGEDRNWIRHRHYPVPYFFE